MTLLLFLLGCSEYGLDKQDSGGEPRAAIELEPSTLDFGALEPGAQASRTFAVTSVGNETLLVSGVSITGSTAFTTTWTSSPLELLEGDHVDVVVTYQAASVSDQGWAVVSSSDPIQPRAAVALTGETLFPAVTIDPTELYFGVVKVGEHTTQAFTVTNSGGTALSVDLVQAEGVGFEANGDDPLVLEPGEASTVAVSFSPPEDGIFEGTAWVDIPELSTVPGVQLHGATAGPVAVCDVGPNPAFAQDAFITWYGSDSYDTAGRTLTEWRWALLDQPAGSTVLMPDGGADRSSFIPDLVGSYTGRLLVVDDAGAWSGPCDVTLEAQVPGDLWVELSWAHDDDDLDLHLLAPGGVAWTSSDCHFLNCLDGALDWGTPGDADDDPLLNADNIFGVGPETIRVPRPESATYAVWVDDFPGSVYTAANDATLSVWLEGVQVWKGTRAISGENTLTPFVEIDVATGQVREL